MAGFVRTLAEGDAYDWHGARCVIKASGADTRGQFAVIESTYPPGLSVHEHRHEGEDELLYVLDGALEGYCAGEPWTAEPGSYVFVPRDQPHSFVVTSDRAARALVIVGPAHLDQQIAAGGTPVGPQ